MDQYLMTQHMDGTKYTLRYEAGEYEEVYSAEQRAILDKGEVLTEKGRSGEYRIVNLTALGLAKLGA